jgi:polysaccharide biosynthesis protein PslH
MAPRNPRLLAVTSELPWPLDTGGHIRTFHLLSALAKEFRVTLVTLTTPGAAHNSEGVDRMAAQGISVRPGTSGSRSMVTEATRAAKAAMWGVPYVMYARHDHRAVRRALRNEAAGEKPAVFYMDHLDSYQYASEVPGVPSVIDLHNVYSRLAERTSREQKRAAVGWYLRREARLLGRVEQDVARHIGCLLTVSVLEREHFLQLGARDVRLAANGVDCAAYEGIAAGRLQAAPRSPTIVYVGSLSWTPNVLAARFLAVAVLPAVRARFPAARLQVVGRNPTAEALELQRLPGVTVVGNVPDIRPHLLEASVLAVPLESGGGTRLKILEAFAAGLPVVSTKIGAEGIDAEHETHLALARREDFPAAICEILGQPERAAAMALRARTLAMTKYDWSAIGAVAASAAREAAKIA